MKKILIRNLRGIGALDFEIPGQGVHLLTGANGTGKTTLLVSLRRIGDSNAFARHFWTGQYSDQLDSTEGASVVYELDAESVTYKYGGTRWAPKPRSQATLLQRMGYPTVIYLGATAERVTPSPAELGLHRANPAPTPIKDALNRIFDTNRFTDLRRMRLAPRGGGGPVAFLVPTGMKQGRLSFSTEKSFSLGELCVMKLVNELHACQNNALVLIDELELALHPTAQVRLLDFIQGIAAEKRLTVIFSTHSVTLLKRARRHQLLLLERTGTAVTCVQGCFPTYALGSIAYEEETYPDAVIYVEDAAAMHATEALCNLALATRFANDPHLQPSYQVVPIGPFMSVVRFLPKSRALLPARVSAHALLDDDVRAETVQGWINNNNLAQRAEFAQIGNILYLPWTPEVGLTEFLHANSAAVQASMRLILGNNQLRIEAPNLAAIPAAGRPRRDACKRIIEQLTHSIAVVAPNRTTDDVARLLYQALAKSYFDANRQNAMALMMPMLVH